MIEAEFKALAETIGKATEITGRLRDLPPFFGSNAGVLLQSIENDLTSALRLLGSTRMECAREQARRNFRGSDAANSKQGETNHA